MTQPTMAAPPDPSLPLVDRLIAYQDAKGVTGLKVVGRLVWTTVGELEVTPAALRASFVGHGLDEKWLPHDPNPRDAFRRAMDRAELHRVPIRAGADRDDEVYLNVLPRLVRQTAGMLAYQLVREVVDSADLRLEYAPFANVQLEGYARPKKGEAPLTLSTEFRPGFEGGFGLHAEEREIFDSTQARWQSCLDHHPAEAVRLTVNRVLAASDRVAVRPSGGVFFVPIQFGERVDGLKSFLQDMSQYVTHNTSACRLDNVPVINGKDEVRMIEHSLKEQVRIEASGLIHEMQQLIEHGARVRTPTADGYLYRVQDLTQMVERYRELLNTEMAEAFGSLQVATAQVMHLRNQLVGAAD